MQGFTGKKDLGLSSWGMLEHRFLQIVHDCNIKPNLAERSRREDRRICAVDRTSYWFTSISETGYGSSGTELMPVSVFIINSDCTIMIILLIKTTTFITAGTPDPVYFHWSGLTVVWHLTSSLCTPSLHNSSHRCFVKRTKKMFSLLYFMSNRILINKRRRLLWSSCLCWSVVWVANALKDASVSELSTASASSSLMSAIICLECQTLLPRPSGPRCDANPAALFWASKTSPGAHGGRAGNRY